MAEENDILAANNALWEKVFASMDKNVTRHHTQAAITVIFLMNAVGSCEGPVHR